MKTLQQRVVARHQGCWNCRSWSAEAGIAYWTGPGGALNDLAVAKRISLESPLGDADPRAQALMQAVTDLNKGMAQTPPTYGVCTNPKARDAYGNEPGRLVSNGFLCDNGWSGISGASLVRADDGKLDKIAAEILEDLDGPDILKPQ